MITLRVKYGRYCFTLNDAYLSQDLSTTPFSSKVPGNILCFIFSTSVYLLFPANFSINVLKKCTLKKAFFSPHHVSISKSIPNWMLTNSIVVHILKYGLIVTCRDLRETIESGTLCITDLFQNKYVAYFLSIFISLRFLLYVT